MEINERNNFWAHHCKINELQIDSWTTYLLIITAKEDGDARNISENNNNSSNNF